MPSTYSFDQISTCMISIYPLSLVLVFQVIWMVRFLGVIKLIAWNALITTRIFIAYLISHLQFDIWNISYIFMKGVANCCFAHIMKNRRQTIQVSPYITKNEVTSCGAPQDSVLSPLLFSISQIISPIHLINWISFCLSMVRTFSMLIRISVLQN